MQDTHRQKNWESEQKEAASKDANSRQPDRQSHNQQDADSRSHQQANQKQRRTDGKTADGFPSDSLVERGRILKQDAQALTTSVQETVELVQRYVSEQVEQRPYTTVAIAAGVGYLLGGGLANRITGSALGTAYRLGLALAARELSSRISIPGVSEEWSRQQGFSR